MTEKDITQAIKAEALRLGFYACGIAPAEPVKTDAEHFRQWLSKGYQAQMKYLEDNEDKRLNPRLLVEDTRSIICVALNYYPQKRLKKEQLQFAYYAYGKDYHEVMKQKLRALYTYIHEKLLPVSGRVFCDTAPVLERYWAQQAGLGWIGKNNQLIIPGAGSYFFLGELFINAKLTYDSPGRNRCGNCNNCQKACPTQALEAPYLLNANKCISYLTIESREEIPETAQEKLGKRVYGCDECQKACPWNRFASPNVLPELQPSEAFLDMQSTDWDGLMVEEYRTLFKGSAVKRAKYEGLMRNLKALQKHSE